MITILLQKILDLLREKLGLINTKPETGSGASVSFETDKELPLDSLTVAITAQQSGEGTPAPDNVRPISGFSSVVVTQKNGSDETVDSITVALGNTYYGGTLDVINGTATIDKKIIDLGDYTYTYNATYERMQTTLSDLKATGTVRATPFICSCFQSIDDGRAMADVPYNSVYAGAAGTTLIYIKTQETYPDAFKTAVTGQKLVYPIEPITLTGLTKDNFTTINGVNVISANSGNVSVGYRISNEMAAANKDITNDVTVNTTDFSGVSYKIIRAGNVVMISLYSATVVNSNPEALFSGLPKGYNNANIMFLDTVSGNTVQGVMSATGYLSASMAEADQRISAFITYITKDEV